MIEGSMLPCLIMSYYPQHPYPDGQLQSWRFPSNTDPKANTGDTGGKAFVAAMTE
jgi:hypothetical protein